jgi:hypothetical protein
MRQDDYRCVVRNLELGGRVLFDTEPAHSAGETEKNHEKLITTADNLAEI